MDMKVEEMSNKVIIVWGFIITMLVLIIYLLGIKYDDEKEYIGLKKEIKESALKYIEENNIEIPFIISSNELIEKGYLDELKLDDKICISTVEVNKWMTFKSFNISLKCEYVPESNEE